MVKQVATCPKCGGQAFKVHLADVDEWISELECTGCGWKVPTHGGDAWLVLEHAG